MKEDYIYKLNQLVEKRDMIENKIQAIKRIAEKDDNPALQFSSSFLQHASITREQAPGLFDKVINLSLYYLQYELDTLNATINKANNLLKEHITDEV
ncbi:MAG: hypothetical protein GX664_03990 [Bacteroidales bacterium]|nr:hypothetical protein [Bacteroidales bacterium]